METKIIKEEVNDENDCDYEIPMEIKEELNLNHLNEIKEEVIVEEEFEGAQVKEEIFPTEDYDFKYQNSDDSAQPFSCKICGSEFSQRKDVTNHERTHTMVNSRRKKLLTLCNLTEGDSKLKIENITKPVDQDFYNSDGDFGGSSSDKYEPLKKSSDFDSYMRINEMAGSNDNETCENCSQTSDKSKESLTKNKRKDVSKWTRTVRKEKRMKGEEYIGHRNIQHLARPMLPSPCRGRQKHKCTDMVEEHHRVAIYTEFRGLSSIDAQRQFIMDNVKRTYKKRTTRNIEDSRKTYTNHYSFTVNGKSQIVCREFFLATLNITDASIRTCFKHQTDSGMLIANRQGKFPPHNKLDVDSENFLRNHINSFPAVESHYCKQSSTKRYLDPNLNISIMHRYYIEACQAENRRQVSLEKYRSVFNKYNLGFHKTKKDRCKMV